MNPQWDILLPVFIATLPLLGAILWNLMDFRAFRYEVRQEFLLIRAELRQIKTEIANIRERVATLEERDRLSHPSLVKP